MRSLLLLSLISLSTACGAERRALREDRQEVRALAREGRELQEAAGDYWLAMRWGDVPTVLSFLPDPDQRMQVAAGGSPVTFRSTQVLRVEVGPPLEEPGRLREGEVMVQVQVYRADDPVLRQEVRLQTWFSDGRGWWVDLGDEFGVSPDTR